MIPISSMHGILRTNTQIDELGINQLGPDSQFLISDK